MATHSDTGVKQTDASRTLAANVVSTTFDSLPDEAVQATKNDILDTLGTIVAGSTFAAGRELMDLGREFGGASQSTVLAFGDKVPAPMAAMTNATMGHALDYDDTHDKALVHVGPAAVSSALALSERAGGVDGKSFITAVALGADLISRMGLATTWSIHECGWMFTSLYGYFGAAAASSKILGLDEQEIVNAFGIAYAQTAGNLQVNIDDEHALTKRLQVGFATRGGLMSALLAQKGLNGAQHSLEGRWGMYNLFQKGNYDRSTLLDGLGEHFEVTNLSFKPWACCRQIHGHVDAALQLRKKYDLKPEDIESVTSFVNRDPHPLCDPLELRRRPTEEVIAQFSIPYSVAVALTHGKVLIKDFTLPHLGDEAVLSIADKVGPRFDSSIPTRSVPPARIQVTTKDGNVLDSGVLPIAKGHPDHPMSWDELADKFRDCCSHSAGALTSDAVERVIELCANLEKLDDIGELVNLLVPAANKA
ncbi:MmgE/PrpD family protein [Streptomyces sp. NPDC056983]|uniref:MmgE/PrpD family protein n=1 Tax=Streptomyces sp. NPDC056983 TaxID=3345987 RepID=UPI003624EA84